MIVWFLDTHAVDGQSDRLRELVDCGALGYGDDMFTAPAPLPGREEELRDLRERLGLKSHGLF